MTDGYEKWRSWIADDFYEPTTEKIPPLGFWRFPYSDKETNSIKWELVATWKADGFYRVCRSKWQKINNETDPAIIDEIFANEHYAIPHEVFKNIQSGGEWPSIHTVRMPNWSEAIKTRAPWSEKWAREQLAQARVKAIETGAAIGDNNSPFEPETADKALAAAILKKGEELKSLLDSWGGEPRNQVEAELVGSYVNVFRNFEKQANAYHASEKAPHLEAGRAVDAKWFPPVRDRAIACATKAKQITEAFKRAEDARKKEEIDRLLADMRKRAEQEAKITGEPVADIPEIKIEPTIIAAQRGRKTTPKVWQVVNPIEFGTYILNMESIPPDMLECLNKLARKMGAAGVNALPGCEFKEKL